MAQTDIIMREVMPNSGKSIHDRVQKLESSMGDLTKTQASQTTMLKEIKNTLNIPESP